MRDAECVQEIANFSQVLPSYLVQSHKKQPIYIICGHYILSLYIFHFYLSHINIHKKTAYIYGRHILSSYIFHIFLQLTFHLVQSHKKQPIYNIYGRHILSSYIFHIFLHLKITKIAYIYIFGHHILSQYIHFAHFISFTYEYSHFPPFLVQRHKKTTYIDLY